MLGFTKIDVRNPTKGSDVLIFADPDGPSNCVTSLVKLSTTIGITTCESGVDPRVYLNYADLDNLILALQEAKKNWVTT